MTANSISFKVGLLATLALAAIVAAAFALGVRGLREDTRTYHTFFDESVSGLDVGAPVKYRGVAVGTVSALAIAPDGRHVEVALKIRAAAVPKPLAGGGGDSGARAQLGSQGITGVKLVDIDIFDPGSHPLPVLPFPPPHDYLPATRSLLGSLETGLERTLERLPEIADALISTLAPLRGIFEELEGQEIPVHLRATIESMQGLVAEARGIVHGVAQTRIPQKAVATIEHLDAAVSTIGEIVERLDSDGGLVTSTQRATESVATLGRGAAGATEDLGRTLRDLGDAARAIREVADELDREPDMLVKGRKARAR